MAQSPALQSGYRQPVSAAESLVDLVRAHADESERDRTLARPVVEAFREAGLFHLFLPERLGGPESDLASATRAVSILSQADGSSGWSSMIASQWAWFAAFLPPEGAAEVLDGTRGVVAGQLRSAGGTAEAVAGGYRVSGRWPFASGSRHGDWLAARCGEVRNGEMLLAPLVVFLPASDATFIDTWHTSGLRGTGSDDFVLDHVFVPEHRAFRLFPPPDSSIPGRLFAKGVYSLPFVTQAGNALGIAEAALASFSDLANERRSSGSDTNLANSQSAQVAFSEAVVTVRSAWAYLESVCAAYEQSLDRGAVGLDARTDLRLAITHGVRSAARAVNSLHETAGASVVYSHSPLDRQWRDINAAAAHLQAAPRAFEVAAQAMLTPAKHEEMMAPFPLGVS